MKVLLRRASLLTVGFIYCLMFGLPFHMTAEDSSENSGKMQLKIDRIGKDETQRYKNVETELEKKFPDLFKQETSATIELKQTDAKDSKKKLQQSLFTMEGEADTTLKDTKKNLFNADYTAPKSSTDDVQEEEGDAGFSKALYIGLIGIVSVLCVGVYTMMRKLSD